MSRYWTPRPSWWRWSDACKNNWSKTFSWWYLDCKALWTRKPNWYNLSSYRQPQSISLISLVGLIQRHDYRWAQLFLVTSWPSCPFSALLDARDKQWRCDTKKDTIMAISTHNTMGLSNQVIAKKHAHHPWWTSWCQYPCFLLYPMRLTTRPLFPKKTSSPSVYSFFYQSLSLLMTHLIAFAFLSILLFRPSLGFADCDIAIPSMVVVDTRFPIDGLDLTTTTISGSRLIVSPMSWWLIQQLWSYTLSFVSASCQYSHTIRVVPRLMLGISSFWRTPNRDQEPFVIGNFWLFWLTTPLDTSSSITQYLLVNAYSLLLMADSPGQTLSLLRTIPDQKKAALVVVPSQDPAYEARLFGHLYAPYAHKLYFFNRSDVLEFDFNISRGRWAADTIPSKAYPIEPRRVGLFSWVGFGWMVDALLWGGVSEATITFLYGIIGCFVVLVMRKYIIWWPWWWLINPLLLAWSAVLLGPWIMIIACIRWWFWSLVYGTINKKTTLHLFSKQSMYYGIFFLSVLLSITIFYINGLLPHIHTLSWSLVGWLLMVSLWCFKIFGLKKFGSLSTYTTTWLVIIVVGLCVILLINDTIAYFHLSHPWIMRLYLGTLIGIGQYQWLTLYEMIRFRKLLITWFITKFLHDQKKSKKQPS